MRRALRVGFAALSAGFAAFGAGGEVRAQQIEPPKINAEQIALAHLVGRFRMPIVCTKSDGSRVNVHESVGFRLDPTAGSGKTGIKATFYGIPIEDARRCSNSVTGVIPDRRGALYLHFRHYDRADRGVSDFRREARDGEVTYHVHRGQLQIREPEAAPGKARRLEFGGGEHRLELKVIGRGSDAARLFADAGSRRSGTASAVRRRYTLSVFGPDEFRMDLHVEEAPLRRARGR